MDVDALVNSFLKSLVLPSLKDIAYDATWKGDPSDPPRPSNPYILFRQWHASCTAEKHDSGDSSASNSDTKLVSLLWKNVPGLQDHFKELGRQVVEKHKERFPGYRYQPAKAKADASGEGTKSGKKGKAARKENTRPYPAVNVASCSTSSATEGGVSGLRVEEEAVDGGMRVSNGRRRKVVDAVKSNSPDVQATYIGTLRNPLEPMSVSSFSFNLHSNMQPPQPLPFPPLPPSHTTFQPTLWSSVAAPAAPEPIRPAPNTQAVPQRFPAPFLPEEQSFPIVVPLARIPPLPFPLQPSSTTPETYKLHADSEPHPHSEEPTVQALPKRTSILKTDSGLDHLDLADWDFDTPQLASPVEFIDPKCLTVDGERAVRQWQWPRLLPPPSPTTLLADYYSAKW